MAKFIKSGRVVLILRGRFAGRKAVIIQYFDGGSKLCPFGHALVAGIDRYPLKVTKKMSHKKIAKRSKIKPFVKLINYNHIMVTRYTLDLDNLRTLLTPEKFKEPSQRDEARKIIKKQFEERYMSGKNRWFFTPIRF
ncbi:uncharacterized protein T551_03209 [Pneumocystis jirovecii RU7]|uniref:KOW domain-containing protein n=1 Tax=Pneumocystis jirovecii (strain RU7) TaxID=1408657 RepID=A0A0W4ZFQ2_PNEJ7|nr:uncharacterized protein T551_03209 [Pneumocystis jirovecii RU7]KTW27215.1 hypothetical protein T551_03209 [Pneumocystis jirovecii RU7]